MKKYIFCLYCVLLMVIVSGCGRNYSQNTPQPIKVVTQVDVTYNNGKTPLRWKYTTQEKMEAILLYLRLLPRGGSAQVDPHRVAGDNYEIVLRYSNGDRRMYYQHADRYLSVDYKPWEQIDPKDGKQLQQLLDIMPSDILQ